MKLDEFELQQQPYLTVDNYNRIYECLAIHKQTGETYNISWHVDDKWTTSVEPTDIDWNDFVAVKIIL